MCVSGVITYVRLCYTMVWVVGLCCMLVGGAFVCVVMGWLCGVRVGL